MLKWQSWVVSTETVGPSKSKTDCNFNWLLLGRAGNLIPRMFLGPSFCPALCREVCKEMVLELVYFLIHNELRTPMVILGVFLLNG